MSTIMQLPTSGASPIDTSEYQAALTQSLAPQFAQSQQNLTGQLAAEGILGSGAGSKQFQDLTANDNATYANALMPLIQQGYAQQFGAQQDNAASDLQSQEFNATQGLNLNEFNANTANQYQLAQMGYGNADYQQQLSELAGIYGTGQSNEGYILGNGVGQAEGAYTGTQNALLPYAAQAGAASQIPNGTSSGNSYTVPYYDTYAPAGNNDVYNETTDPTDSNGLLSGFGET